MDGEQPSTAQPQPQSRLVQTFACPNCGAPVTIRASGHTVVVTCRGCQSLIDVATPNHQIVSRYVSRRKFEPLIPLGSRGELFGNPYEVIGFMVRSDTESEFRWQEYLLFNPYHGFRWLAVANGHWNFLTMIKEQPSGASDGDVRYDGKNFALYFRGRAQVDYVFGEFYWRVRANDVVKVADHIAPPQILSVELDQGERVWSLGQYVEPDVVRGAFKVETPFPVKVGVAPNQPSPYPRIGGPFFFFVALLLAIQVLTDAFAGKEPVYQSGFEYARTAPDKVKVTPPFELKGRASDVEVVSVAPVNNHWLELRMSLIETNTGKTVSFEQGVEFYSGSDSDGAWSEGKHRHRILLSSVPAGTYYLTITPQGSTDTSYSVAVRRDVPAWSNFWIALTLLTLPAMLVGLLRYNFETRRWADSEFSPYQSSSEEEE